MIPWHTDPSEGHMPARFLSENLFMKFDRLLDVPGNVFRITSERLGQGHVGHGALGQAFVP